MGCIHSYPLTLVVFRLDSPVLGLRAEQKTGSEYFKKYWEYFSN